VRTHTSTAQDTEEFAAQLARARPVELNSLAVLYLSGELGSGKTTFARGFLRAFGITQPVRSPTFTLMELYPVGELTLLHVDLYRLDQPSELDALGLREWARPGLLWLIEWPEKGAGRLPSADLMLAFSVAEAGHDITVMAKSALGRAWTVQLTGEQRHA